MTQECATCKTPMAKTGSMDSGNSTFIEFACKNCGEKKTVCAGLSVEQTPIKH